MSAAILLKTYNTAASPLPGIESGYKIDDAEPWGDVDFGYTQYGKAPYVRNFAFYVRNVGDQDLSISDIQLPDGFAFGVYKDPTAEDPHRYQLANFKPAVLKPNEDYSFWPIIDTTRIGRVKGPVKIVSNASPSPFTFEIAGTVYGAAADAEWGTVTDYAYTDTVAARVAVDYNGGVVSQSGSRLAGFSLPAGRHSVKFDLSAEPGTAHDVTLRVFKDPAHVGFFDLSERGAPVGTLATRGEADPSGADPDDSDTIELGGGHYFVEARVASPLDTGEPRSLSSFAESATYTVKLAAEELGSPAVGVSAGGRAVASGGTVDFGDVAVGAAAPRTIVVTNTGDAPLHLGAFDGEANTGFTSDALSGDVLPGKSRSVTVRIVSAVAGVKAATFVIRSANADPFTIRVTGKVVPAGSAKPNVRPTMDKLVAAADSTGKSLVLRVPAPADADGVVIKVQFFKDDGDGRFDPAKDKWVGTDTSAKKGWKAVLPLAGLPWKRSLVFFARAVDDDGAISRGKSATVRLSKARRVVPAVVPTSPAQFSVAPVVDVGDDLWALV